MLHFELDIDRRIGLWDTAAMPRIFEIGQRAAHEQLPAIRRLLERRRQACRSKPQLHAVSTPMNINHGLLAAARRWSRR